MFHDFSAHLQEARIAVEAAIATADIVAQNDIVECQSFNQLLVYLHDAVEALAKVESEPATPQYTIFPTQETANDYLASIEPMSPIGLRGRGMGDVWCRCSGYPDCFRL